METDHSIPGDRHRQIPFSQPLFPKSPLRPSTAMLWYTRGRRPCISAQKSLLPYSLNPCRVPVGTEFGWTS
jgi:hypothetical protein